MIVPGDLPAKFAAYVVVEAKDDAARLFYEHCGFVPFPERESRLYLPLRTVACGLAPEP